MSTTTINGLNLYYELYGNSEAKETIVFMNGVMASTTSWADQVQNFVKMGYQVLLHDFRGQLKSDKPAGPYTFKLHAEDTIELMRSLGIESAHLVGTSYGGEVSMRMAIDYPKRVKSLSIIDSVSELDEVLRYFVSGWMSLAEIGNGELFFNGMLPSIYHESYVRNNKTLLEKRAKAFNETPQSYFQGQIELYKTFLGDVYMTNELFKINCPTIVICGQNDILKPVKFSEILAEHIPGAEFVTIPDCGHVTIFEKPDALNSILLGFILKQSL